jgi:CRISPR-associated protein Csd2
MKMRPNSWTMKVSISHGIDSSLQERKIMSTSNALQNKIDFALVIRVANANPNGDPLNGNRPRTNYGGFGEISDVALKRKLRDRLQEAGEGIFLQSDDRKIDGESSLRARAESEQNGLGKKAFDKGANPEDTVRRACEKWFDVRALGQIFPFKGATAGEGVSIPIRGPVTIQSAYSKEPVSISSKQIVKSASLEATGGKRGSDTMGMKHTVDFGIYECFGSINPQLAERTGFSYEDASLIKSILPRLFENDASSARPDGSMEVVKVIWWEHSTKGGQYSSAKVHRTLTVNPNGTIELSNLDGLAPEVIEGF